MTCPRCDALAAAERVYAQLKDECDPLRADVLETRLAEWQVEAANVLGCEHCPPPGGTCTACHRAAHQRGVNLCAACAWGD